MNEAGRSDTVMGLHLMENDTFKHWPTGLRGSGCSISSNAVETAKLHFRSLGISGTIKGGRNISRLFRWVSRANPFWRWGPAFLDLDCRVVSP
jgi:hypothetical protein